jgi:hypothetical protein
MSRILSEKSNRALPQVIYFVGVRRFGEAHLYAVADAAYYDERAWRDLSKRFEAQKL